MMIRALITFLAALLLAIAASAGLPAVANAVGLVVTPASVSADYSGTITLNITGVVSGQTVVVEQFLDPDGDGLVGPEDKLLLRFTVTDGQRSLIGGQRNINVPGDEDLSEDGNIQTVLNFKALPEANRFSAHFIYRVSPVSGGFTPVSIVFPVTQPSLPQGVTGQVTSGGSPVAGAFVFLLPASGPGIVVATIADSNGNFTLNTAPGTYQLLALKSGQVFDFSTAPAVTINATVVTVRNLSMLPATGPTISGQLTDAVSHAGIAAVQVFASTKSGQDNTGLATIVHTDDAGNFNIPVSTASTEWRLEFSNKDAALLGYVAPSREKVDTSAGNVSNLSIQWTKANALIFGSLKDNSQNPLPGIEIDASDSNNLYQNLGYTDDLGNYAVGVSGGNWNVGPSGDDPALDGYVVSGQNVNVSNNEAVQVNLVAQAACAHLRGHVIDGTTGVGNVSVLACLQNQGGQCPSSTTGSDGSFDIAVPGGMWNLFLESNSAAQQGLISSQLSITVTCSQDQNGLTLPVRHSTGHITGRVHDGSNAPISNLFVYAFATIGGLQYNTSGQTDNDGMYSLPVANGSWQVGVECNALQSRGFNCPPQQVVPVNGTNPVVNFVVQPVSACVGDCNDNHQVTVDEILLMVNIALGNGNVMDCEAGDANHNGQITVDEILAAVNKALSGC
jgi:hypothetical protein